MSRCRSATAPATPLPTTTPTARSCSSSAACSGGSPRRRRPGPCGRGPRNARLDARAPERDRDRSGGLPVVCGPSTRPAGSRSSGWTAPDMSHDLPAPATAWQYGLIPSSHTAIEAQFGLAAGSVSIASTEWAKSLKRTRVQPLPAGGQAGAASSAKKAPAKQPPRKSATAPPPSPTTPADRLSGFLVPTTRARRAGRGRTARLVRGSSCARPGATATSLPPPTPSRSSRRRSCSPACGTGLPTPYDLQDAAVTRIEKDAVPGRRDVRRLVEIMMGGDRIARSATRRCRRSLGRARLVEPLG